MTAQLELQLDDVRKVFPWGGRSPRVLTTSYQTFSLAREGMGRLDLDATHVGDIEGSCSSEQLLLFISGG